MDPEQQWWTLHPGVSHKLQITQRSLRRIPWLLLVPGEGCPNIVATLQGLGEETVVGWRKRGLWASSCWERNLDAQKETFETPEQGARGSFGISLGILWLENQNRTIPWWAQRAALIRAANKVMKRGNQDRAEMPNPGSAPDPGSPTAQNWGQGREEQHLCLHGLPSPWHGVCLLSKQALCGDGQRMLHSTQEKGEGWAFVNSRILQYLDCSYFLGYYRSQNSIQISSAWTLIFPHFHWHHIKSVSQSTRTLKLSDNLGGPSEPFTWGNLPCGSWQVPLPSPVLNPPA